MFSEIHVETRWNMLKRCIDIIYIIIYIGCVFEYFLFWSKNKIILVFWCDLAELLPSIHPKTSNSSNSTYLDASLKFSTSNSNKSFPNWAFTRKTPKLTTPTHLSQLPNAPLPAHLHQLFRCRLWCCSLQVQFGHCLGTVDQWIGFGVPIRTGDEWWIGELVNGGCGC